jgi:hypothetical protein
VINNQKSTGGGAKCAYPKKHLKLQ